jgi:hypothetical protein
MLEISFELLPLSLLEAAIAGVRAGRNTSPRTARLL